MKVTFDDRKLMKDMESLVSYSQGFLEGTELAKPAILNKLGKDVIQTLRNFVDSNARVNPSALQHVYEWSMTGTPAGRLFDINYLVTGNGLSFNSTFRQSSTIQKGSSTPFYDKARIMEEGIPVIIKPKGRVLAFVDDGEQVFTSKPVVVSNPGGAEARGSFEQVINSFFESYFTQSYIASSGIFDYLKNPFPYATNLQRGMRAGKAYGKMIGLKWASGGAAA
jgi:hypothetical protein